MISQLADLTWKEAAARISAKTVALWPIGAIEAHGPHLPLDTDVVLSVETVRRAALRLEAAGREVLVLPALAFTPAGYAGSFAGTLSISDNAAFQVITDSAGSLAARGLGRIVLVSCHVDPANTAMLAKAAGAINQGGTALKAVFPDLTRKPWALRMPDEFKSGGAHAGEFETSLMMAAAPARVREEIRKRLPRVVVNLGQKIKEGAQTFHECGGPEAYFGDPASATAEKGQSYFEILAGIVADAVQEGA